MKSIKIDEISVVVSHPHGDVEVPLKEWIRTGLGPRSFVSPSGAKHIGTGKELPLSIIPLKYRNNFLSRFLISLGILKNPWR